MVTGPLKKIREESGLTQQDMANKLGVPRVTYSYWEQHPERLTVENAKRVCSVLGLEYGRIFFSMIAN